MLDAVGTVASEEDDEVEDGGVRGSAGCLSVVSESCAGAGAMFCSGVGVACCSWSELIGESSRGHLGLCFTGESGIWVGQVSMSDRSEISLSDSDAESSFCS